MALALALAMDTRDRADADVLGSFSGLFPVLLYRASCSLPDVQRAILQAVYHRHVHGDTLARAYAEAAAGWDVPLRHTLRLSQQDLPARRSVVEAGESPAPDALTMRSNVLEPNWQYVIDGVEGVLAFYPDRLSLTLLFNGHLFTDEAARRVTDTVRSRLLSIEAATGDDFESTPRRPGRGRLLPVGRAGSSSLMWADPMAIAAVLQEHPAVLAAEVEADGTPDQPGLRAEVLTEEPIPDEELRSLAAAAGANRPFVLPPRHLDVDHRAGQRNRPDCSAYRSSQR